MFSQNELEALQEFQNRLLRALGKQVVVIRLFGSKVRGDFTQNSDLDVLVITKDHEQSLFRKITDLACEVNLEYGVYISAKSISQERYDYLRELNTPFVRNIEQGGKTLWKTA